MCWLETKRAHTMAVSIVTLQSLWDQCAAEFRIPFDEEEAVVSAFVPVPPPDLALEALGWSLSIRDQLINYRKSI